MEFLFLAEASDYAQLALTAISLFSVAVSAFFSWSAKRVSNQETIQNSFYAQIVSECESLRESSSVLRERTSRLEDENAKLTTDLQFFRENHLAVEARDLVVHVFEKFLNVPCWVRDVGHNRWYLNEAYCKEFSVIRDTFWTPINIFGRYDHTDAVKYASNDLKVVETGTTIEFRERVRRKIMDPECGEFGEYMIRKTPFFINGRPYIVGKVLKRLDSEGDPGWLPLARE